MIFSASSKALCAKAAGLLLVGFCLFWLPAPAAATGGGRVHQVKRGETLTGIAKTYGVSIQILARENGISRSAFLQVGQRLRIPSASASPSAAQATRSGNPASLTPGLQQAIDKAPVRKGRWRYIVIHHSGVNTGTVQGMDQYHRKVRRMENGLAYHFVIGNGSGMSDGLIAVGRRWNGQLDGGHLASEAQNKVALGICLVGNFDRERPSAKQMESLRILVTALLKRCNLPVSAVKVHREINVIGTRCPGARFPTKTFITSLKSAIKSK